MIEEEVEFFHPKTFNEIVKNAKKLVAQQKGLQPGHEYENIEKTMQKIVKEIMEEQINLLEKYLKN